MFASKILRKISRKPRAYTEIPTPKSLPLIGTKLAVWAAGSSKNLHEYIHKRHRELGPIFREQLGSVEGIFLADATAIRDVFSQEGKYPVHIIPQPWTIFNTKRKCSRGLLFMDGRQWLDHRQVLNGILLRGDFEWVQECCDFVVGRFVENLKKCNDTNDLDRKLYRVFLDVLVSVLLGCENYAKNEKKIENLVEYLAINVSFVFETTSKLMMLPVELAEKFGFPQWKNFEKSMENALDGAYKLVDKLNQECTGHNGLLRRMEEDRVDRDVIKAIVADLILAAADTTAYTMQWMLYLVTKNPRIQDKIREESSNPDSNYSRNVLKETLRLYPVAPFITRFLPQEIEALGYKIPSNSLVLMSIYTTGRDEKYFKNADLFQPERWNRGNEKLATRQASLPFAMGVRSCVGKKLAEYELQKMLNEIVRNFKLELRNENDIKMILKMIAVPSEPIRLNLKKI